VVTTHKSYGKRQQKLEEQLLLARVS